MQQSLRLKKLLSSEMKARVKEIKDDISRYRIPLLSNLRSKDADRHLARALEQVNIKVARLFQDLDALIPK